MCEDSFRNTFIIQINEQRVKKEKKEESVLSITSRPIFSRFLFLSSSLRTRFPKFQ